MPQSSASSTSSKASSRPKYRSTSASRAEAVRSTAFSDMTCPFRWLKATSAMERAFTRPEGVIFEYLALGSLSTISAVFSSVVISF